VIPKKDRRKLVLLMMVLTPGIPEYLTGSTPVLYLFTNPLQFFISLGFNVAPYTTGAIIIRDVAIKYRKGWLTILLLGAAYGIMEEGITVHTFFQASGQPVSLLSIYGRSMGVNWIWAIGITFFHSIYSIALPIFILSLAYLGYRNERLTGRRGIWLAFCIYVVDILLINIMIEVSHIASVPSFPEYFIFTLLAGVFVVVAFLIPRNAFHPAANSHNGRARPFILGFLLFPIYFIFSYITVKANGVGMIPPVADAALLILSYVVLFILSVRSVSCGGKVTVGKYYYVTGAMVPLMVLAEIQEFFNGLHGITISVIVAIVLLWRFGSLIRKNAPDGTITSS